MYDEAIAYAKEVWEEEILRYCSALYETHWLPSHDIEHHRRVWKNACLISSNLTFKTEIEPEVFFGQLIITCYFHDTGLLNEKGPKHGKESRRICEQFLKLHTNKINFETDTLLLAIENHDDKDYTSDEELKFSMLYQVLTLADDLDAFGAIGCYRYIEIYLMRDLNSHEIPGLILDNAESRFKNFKSKLKESDYLLQLIRGKYEHLRKLLKTDSFIEIPESLVEWIYKKMVLPQIDPFTSLKEIGTEDLNNERIKFFLRRLVREINS